MVLLENSTKRLKKKKIQYNPFQKMKEERVLPNSFYNTNITWDQTLTNAAAAAAATAKSLSPVRICATP